MTLGQLISISSHTIRGTMTLLPITNIPVIMTLVFQQYASIWFPMYLTGFVTSRDTFPRFYQRIFERNPSMLYIPWPLPETLNNDVPKPFFRIDYTPNEISKTENEELNQPIPESTQLTETYVPMVYSNATFNKELSLKLVGRHAQDPNGNYDQKGLAGSTTIILFTKGDIDQSKTLLEQLSGEMPIYSGIAIGGPMAISKNAPTLHPFVYPMFGPMDEEFKYPLSCFSMRGYYMNPTNQARTITSTNNWHALHVFIPGHAVTDIESSGFLRIGAKEGIINFNKLIKLGIRYPPSTPNAEFAKITFIKQDPPTYELEEIT